MNYIPKPGATRNFLFLTFVGHFPASVDAFYFSNPQMIPLESCSRAESVFFFLREDFSFLFAFHFCPVKILEESWI